MKRLLFIPFLLLNACVVVAQSKPEFVPDLEDLLSKQQFDQAHKVVRQRIEAFINNRNIDTLKYYVTYLGKTTENLNGAQQAQHEVLVLLNRLKKQFPQSQKLIKIFFNGAYFISNSGNHQLALKTAEEIDNYFLANRQAVLRELPSLYYIMGDFAARMADNELAKSKYLQSLDFLKKIPDPDKADLVKAFHSMGFIFYNNSQYDSSLYYNSKAIAILGENKDNIYAYNRLAAIQNHVGGVYTALGQTKEAKKYYEAAIENSRKFLASPEPPPSVKESTVLTQLYAIGNLGTLYLEINDLAKAFSIYQYYQQQILEKFSNNRFEIGRSLLFLAIISNERHQYAQGKDYSLDAIINMKASGNPETGWEADAYAQAAVAFHHLNGIDSASFYYEKANQIQKKINTTSYDKQYFYFQGLLSDFYSTTGRPDKAIAIASDGLHYLTRTTGQHSIRTIRMLNSLVIAQYKGTRYKDAEKNSIKGITSLRLLLSESKDFSDSLTIEKELPGFILFKAKSSYQQLSKKEVPVIKALLSDLEEAMNIFEKRKATYTDYTGVGGLLTEYKELTDFIKQLNFELLKLSSDKTYIDNIISAHEGSLYTRIRSRMEQQDAIQFSRVPEHILKEEADIKEKLQNAFSGNGTPDERITSYISNIARLNTFQGTLKAKYPEYYKMRYGATSISLKELSKTLPGDLTVIRYLFSDEALFALVVTNNGQKFISLPYQGLKDKITLLSAAGADAARTTALAFQLYEQLWKPIQNEIKSRRIIIIPDGILYNLSFEMLTPVATGSFAELSKNCLLNRYAISYHYSLLALQTDAEPAKKMKGNFVAFAPGFFENTRQQYLAVAKNDSLHLDKTYLSLLPLPFTHKLVNRIKEKFGGNVFSENGSTADVFRTESGNNHIIHIATHAEANNDYPEYSRLIFAKDNNNPMAENSVYLYDIYNCDLTSDLSVLTACESGKPGYQDGEGMISMAHAFSYAGSKSIMTGLWKLDEQATALITGHFYTYLKAGLSKDEALQKAKLDYLQTANGRMIAPQYWAGLVLMGNTDAILLQNNLPWLYYVIAAALVCALLFFLYWKKKAAK